MKRFNHTMIFLKLTNQYKIRDIYINHNNCLGHMLFSVEEIMKTTDEREISDTKCVVMR